MKESYTLKLEGKEWTDCLHEAYDKKKKDIKLDGFRKGQVPYDIYVKKMGIDIDAARSASMAFYVPVFISLFGIVIASIIALFSRLPDKGKTFCVNDYMLPVVISTVFTGIFFCSCLYKVFVNSDLLNKIIEYPLKIPFWLSIFLLLLIKILFNVLPRSISINYNKKYIERACIV